MNYTKTSGEGFWIVDKKIAKEFGLEVAVLLADLISKEKYFENNNLLDDDGFFYNTVDSICEDTGINKKKQLKLVNTLVENNFIEITYKGLPKKRHYKINHKKINEYLSITTKEIDVDKKQNSQSGQNDPTVGVKMTPQEGSKRPTNNNKYNNNKYNNNNNNILYNNYNNNNNSYNNNNNSCNNNNNNNSNNNNNNNNYNEKKNKIFDVERKMLKDIGLNTLKHFNKINNIKNMQSFINYCIDNKAILNQKHINYAVACYENFSKKNTNTRPASRIKANLVINKPKPNVSSVTEKQFLQELGANSYNELSAFNKKLFDKIFKKTIDTNKIMCYN